MLIIQRPTVEQLDDGETNLGRFAIGPLEPGFGHTLGNSLRRTLLSSVPGAAITTVRFDDALHEFDTLPGVVEDVTDVILNLKDIVLTCEGDEPVTLRLDARGPGDVTAGDIACPPEVEILNGGIHLAKLDGKGRLAIDLTVERGRGWIGSDRPVNNSIIGVIPIDAIFSPIRRVSITVEPTRVEMSTDFDRLILEIETDGAITPREALASAGCHPAFVGAARRGDERRTRRPDPGRGPGRRLGFARISTSRSRISTCPNGPATVSSGPRSTVSVNYSPRPKTTCWPSPISARSPSTK